MITINNELELADELATQMMLNIISSNGMYVVKEEDLMELSTDGLTLSYKEEYQDLFNHWYDHYSNLLMEYSE
jgi:hypothetical protein